MQLYILQLRTERHLNRLRFGSYMLLCLYIIFLIVQAFITQVLLAVGERDVRKRLPWLCGLSSVEQHTKPYECYTNGMKEQHCDFLWQTSSVNKSSIAGVAVSWASY